MDTKRLILYVVAILVVGPLAFVLVTHQAPPMSTGSGPSVYVSNSFGGGNVQVFASFCAGKVQLTQGAARVNDACFTGEANIVACSDITSANPVRCEPSTGTLTVEGHANDNIAFARMK